MTLVILAAGMGSRYGGLKQMDPMNEDGDFIIDFSVFDAIRAGFDRVIFIIKRENYDAFRNTIGARIEKKIKVTYAFQELDDIPDGYSIPEGRIKPWGTTHALRSIRGLLDEPYGVINADDFYGRDTFEKLAAHLKKMKEAGPTSPEHGCMIGFPVRNTLTENGTCSRGQCTVDNKGMLTSIVERIKVKKDGDNAAYLADNGDWIPLTGDTTVSMNCWGLPASSIDFFDREFSEFMQALPNTPNPQKAECLLPNSVDKMMKAGILDIAVYRTSSVWFGVTYPEDKPDVVRSIGNLVAAGEYPTHLWEDVQ